MRKKKHFTGFILAVAIALGVLAVGCIFLFVRRGKHSNVEIPLNRLSEDGEYKFEGLEWGISPEDAARHLPYAIELDEYRNDYEGPAGTTFYKAEDGLVLNGQSAVVTFEFQDSELAIVKFDFHFHQDEEQGYEQWFETVSAEMLRLYGEESRSFENANDRFQSKGYIWETEQTMLQIVWMTGESIYPGIMIGVGRKP